MAQATHAAFNAPVGDVDAEPMTGEARVSAGAARPDVRISIHRDLADMEREWRAFRAVRRLHGVPELTTGCRPGSAISARMPALRPPIVAGRDSAGAIAVHRCRWRSDARLGSRTDLARVRSRAITTRRCWRRSSRSRSTPRAFCSCGATSPARLQRHPGTRLRRRPASTKMPEQVGGAGQSVPGARRRYQSERRLSDRLAGDWETFYDAKRSSTTRRRDRTKRKRLAEFGEVAFVNPQDPADTSARSTR